MAEPPAPTIAQLMRMGLTGVLPLCRDCKHAGAVSFAALRLPEDTPFPLIARKRRFRCQRCGSRDCRVTPDWRDYHASGMG